MSRPPKLYRMVVAKDLKPGAEVTAMIGKPTLTLHARKGEVELRNGRWYLTKDGVKAAKKAIE